MGKNIFKIDTPRTRRDTKTQCSQAGQSRENVDTSLHKKQKRWLPFDCRCGADGWLQGNWSPHKESATCTLPDTCIAGLSCLARGADRKGKTRPDGVMIEMTKKSDMRVGNYDGRALLAWKRHIVSGFLRPGLYLVEQNQPGRPVYAVSNALRDLSPYAR